MPQTFGARQHPNEVIAKREMENQERSRLRRLSEVRPTASNTSAPFSKSWERPMSSGRQRPSSRPQSGQLSGHRNCDEQFESLKSRAGVSSPSGSPSRTGFKGGKRSASETSTRLRTSFLLSPQRRLEDAASQFQVSTTQQAQALQEELQSWYFGNGETFHIEVGNASPGRSVGSHTGGVYVDGCPWTTSVDVRSRPAVDVLEEAAAAVKAKVAASGAYGPPRDSSTPGRAGGGRGIAAAAANRQLPAGVPRLPGQ